jgi:outer membrane protein
MKPRVILAFILISAAGPRLTAEQIDLPSYLRLVEERNRNLEVARQEVAQTQEMKDEARAGLLPNVGLQAGYTRNLKQIEQPMASYATPSAVPGVYPITYTDQVVSYENELDLAAALNFNIFDGTAWSRYRQASMGVEARRAAYDYQREAVMNGAKKLYYQTLLLNEVVKIKEASEKIAQDAYNDAQAKFKVGLTTELDALMAETAWKGKIPETAEARRNRDVAMLGFKQLAGIPDKEDVSLTESVEKFPEMPAEVSLSDALSARSDYALLLRQRSLAGLAIEAAKANYLPVLTGSFTVADQRFGHDFGFNDYDPLAVQVGVKLTLPLFEGGYRSAKLAEEDLGLKKSDILIAQKMEDIRTELTSVMLRLGEAKERIDGANSVVTVARRAFDKASDAFKNGFATQLQLNQASLNLEGSRLALLSAIYDYLAAYFDWELAVGK